MELTEKTIKLVDLWLKWDKNPQTRKEIQDLVNQGNEPELAKMLHKRIEFGTAGLRGAMRAGFRNMNDLTGLAVYLEINNPKSKEKGVVVGFDNRHNSRTFALLTALHLAFRGFRVYLFRDISPTPFVSFSIEHMKAAAGIMITASHNPKGDNGYKVYWSNTAQIIEPHDSGIEKCIENNLVPWNVPLKLSEESVYSNSFIEDPTNEILNNYYPRIKEWCFHTESNAANGSNLKITYTSMHGVGYKFAQLAFEVYGLLPFIPVVEQIMPDPDFPTVVSPNPEEGRDALKLAMNTADSNNSTIIIANDPDADRMAVAEKMSNGEWKIFTGNELGILLASWCVSSFIKNNPTINHTKIVVLNSTVSSKMLKALAEREKIQYFETLTGFKWLGNTANDLMKNGLLPIFAFEEAIGYMIGHGYWDKDGVKAAVVFAEMATYHYARGSTLVQELEKLYQTLGLYLTKNGYFLIDPSRCKHVFDEIRNSGIYVKKCGEFDICAIRDLTSPGYDSSTPNKVPILPVSNTSQMITFTFTNGGVATLRGSGTEPKLKYYVELPGKKGQSREKLERELNILVDSIIEYIIKPEKFGMKRSNE